MKHEKELEDRKISVSVSRKAIKELCRLYEDWYGIKPTYGQAILYAVTQSSLRLKTGFTQNIPCTD